ncbi:MAG: hypothetical protein WDM81_18985 [Rhizomicrobium sp.]
MRVNGVNYVVVASNLCRNPTANNNGIDILEASNVEVTGNNIDWGRSAIYFSAVAGPTRDYLSAIGNIALGAVVNNVVLGGTHFGTHLLVNNTQLTGGNGNLP